MKTENSLALVGLVATTLALRLALATQLWLSDDEAFYWALSQNPATSYVVHPPLMMWLISGSTALFGHGVWGVRFPALACSTLGMYWLLRLGAAFDQGHWRRGLPTLVLLLTASPLLLLGAVLTGPDLPLVAFWCGLMETTYRIGFALDTKPAAWLRLGVLAGLALLSKYTAVLALLCSALCLVSTSAGRRWYRTPWPYVALLTTTAIFAPVLWWNYRQGWASFDFQFLSRHEGHELSFRRWGLFWLSQFFLIGPALVLGWFALAWRTLRGRTGHEERYLFAWAGLPALVFFVQPLLSPFKIHWALPAFFPLVLWGAKLAAHRPPRWWRTAIGTSAWITALGVLALSAPAVPHAARLLGLEAPQPGADATNDFYGWSHFKSEWERLPPDLRELSLLTTRYQIAAQAAFALGDKRRVALIPHQAPELRDWGGPTQAPDRFLYVADTRYHDPPEAAYHGYTCQPVQKQVVRRGPAVAKEIYLELCSRVIMSSSR